MDRRSFLRMLFYTTIASFYPGGIWHSLANPEYDRLGPLLPRRILGKTGVKVTMLGMGGAHMGRAPEKEAQKMIELALEKGIRFFDTAHSYARGRSEKRYGKFLTPKYRDVIFLMSKSEAVEPKLMQQHLEDSLRRLKTDYLDLWQVHAIGSPQDAEQRYQAGIFKVLEKALVSGKVRHVGFTGHRDPKAHLHVLQLTQDHPFLETCQMPINVLDAASSNSFIREVLPELLKRKMGVIAMKTLAEGHFFRETYQRGRLRWTTTRPIIPDRMSVQQALYFVWSLPVSVLVTGAEKVEHLREKIELARQFRPLSEKEREALLDKIEDLANLGEHEHYKKFRPPKKKAH